MSGWEYVVGNPAATNGTPSNPLGDSSTLTGTTTWGYGGGGSNPSELADRTLAGSKEMAKTIYEMFGKNLNTINDLNKASDAAAKAQIRDLDIKADEDWFAQQQKLQSTLSGLFNKGGNTWNGSALGDLVMMAKRYDDMSDASLKGDLRQNTNDILRNLYTQVMENWQAARNLQTDAYSRLSELGVNTATNISNIDLGKGSGFYSGSNINRNSSDYAFIRNPQAAIMAAVPTINDPGYPILKQLGYYNPDGPNTTKSGGSAKTSMGTVNKDYWNNLSLGYDNRKAKGD